MLPCGQSSCSGMFQKVEMPSLFWSHGVWHSTCSCISLGIKDTARYLCASLSNYN